MEKLQKERSIARSIFTKCKNKFVEALEKDKDSYSKIRSSFEILAQKAELLFSIDEKVQAQWLTQEDLAEEDVVEDHEKAYEYQFEFYELKTRYESVEQSKSPPESHYDSLSVANNRKRNLPKLELAKFDGEAKNWLGFWSSFKKIHADESIDDDDKMAYLIQSMIPDSPAQNLVKSFPPCGENYAQAVQQLKMRYGRDELLIEIYVRELLTLVLSQAKETHATPISSLYDKLKTQLRALEILGVTSEKYAAMLYPLVESALPEELLRVWERQRSREKNEDILNSLLEFVKIEVESEERIKLARRSLGANKVEEEARVPTAACLVAGAESKKATTSRQSKKTTPCCIFCDKQYHSGLECTGAQKMTVEARRDIAEKKKVCFVCLKTGHQAKACKLGGICICCQKKHAVILCPDVGIGKQNEKGATSSDNTEASLASGCNGTTLLQTLTVKIGNEKVRAFIDTGAQRSYLREDVAVKLGLKPNREEVLRHYLFGGIETKDERHQVYDLKIKSMNGDATLDMVALSKERICGYIPRIKNDEAVIQKLKMHKLTLTDVGDDTPEVGLLIGADYAGRIMKGKVIHVNEDLHAIQTTLGWTLQGIVARENHSIIASVDLCDQDISKLWDLEVLGIEDPKDRLLKNRTQEEAIETFKESITINNEGRYEVTLPWKMDRPDLLDNKGLAEKRLESTTKRLESLNELQNYGKVFEEWMELGIIEIDPDVTSPGHYLSHHAVIKESSLTTRVRPVFDASARDFNGNSINSCLEKGQNFLELIPILLTRFRMNMIGITSDIKKAFLQISISEHDRRYLRFLWWSKEGEMIVYRHCRVVFGLTCSPFLLAATLIHHLEKHVQTQYERSADLLKNSFYVDNCVVSLDSQLEAEKFIDEAKMMMNEGKFELRGWVTAPVQCKDTETQTTISVLGMNWDTKDDVLRCNVNAVKDCKEPITRRELLSMCNRVFDPIGFTSPTTLIPKLLLQKTWSLHNVDWDTPLPEEMNKEFKTWLEDIHWLQECSIPRRLTEKPIREGEISLHVFSDASKNAYATCIFLRSETGNNEVSVQLVLAKSRVTPVKEITIPRLELIAAVMSTRLYAQVCEALQLENVKAHFWSDSSVVVTWIITDKEWSVFVRNRVREIREKTQREDWRHINGSDNPADLPSRGCSAKKLAESRWWDGPAWLKENEEKWPTAVPVAREDEVNQELKKTERVVNSADVVTEPFTTCLTNMSKYSKIVRTIAWIWRFYNNSMRTKEKVRGDITFEETEHAERSLLRVVQQESFGHGKLRGMKDLEKYEDENGLLRVKTRLTLSEESDCFKTPILLSSKHQIVERLVEQRHRQHLHAGVNILFSTIRNNYWILGGRKLAKRIISRCMICKRFTAGHYKTPTAPLPANRVKNTGVFQVTGIDAAGPLILNTGEKCWFILFTCAVYRAVHIELVMSMSTDCFLMALRRFIARRGRVQTIYSDNGTNFVGAENLLTHVNWDVVQEHSTTVHKIKWIFNPPASPWWGGWWERIIRMIKELLRRNLGAASLSFVELETVLCDIEAVVNARPLTYSAEDDTLRPLTPETFLHPLQGTEVADLDTVDSETMNARQKYLQKVRADLRQRFRSEYLALLVSKPQDSTDPVRVGDVVLIETDAKRIKWPLGLVEEIYVGKDGQHRVAKIKTTEGYRTRAVQRLYPLEVKRGEDPTDTQPDETKAVQILEEEQPAPPRTSRSGRPVRVPRRLDL